MSTGHSVPAWGEAPACLPVATALPSSTQVCVIGAGVAGLSVALGLLEAGYQVVVLERDGIGAGETGRSTAHLSWALDDRFHVLEKEHGEEGARVAAESHRAAVAQIERWVADYRIDCAFARIDGYLFRGGDDDPEVLEREFDAALRAGVEVERVQQLPGHPGVGAALRFPRQARIDPLRYVQGLARAVQGRGGQLVKAEATGIDDGVPCRVELQDGRELRCDVTVVCTNVPFHRRVAYHTKQAAYRTFVMAARAPAGALHDALYWDTCDPYHYVRLADTGASQPLVLVGGADHKTGQRDPGEHALDALERWARRFCPTLGPVERAWSGQVIEPVDSLAYIGRDAGAARVFVVTGDSGNGMTHGTIAASLIPSLIAGRAHPWSALYAPDRHPLNRDWLRENANVLWQYTDWVAAAEPVTLDSLGPGQGAILRRGLHRYAVCRDDGGELHAFSARCTHLGCCVRWNRNENSWDCPCHGSRFGASDGAVLNGPAVEPLQPVPLSALGDDTGERPAA